MDFYGTPDVEGFVGDYAGCVKQPDMCFVPRVGPDWDVNADFPSVVLEVGYAESVARLTEDGELWRKGSSHAVKVVLLVKFRRHGQNSMGVVLSIGRAFPDLNGQTTLYQDYDVFPISQLAIPDPTISFDELYAGNCPPTLNPETQIPLNLTQAAAVQTEGGPSKENTPQMHDRKGFEGGIETSSAQDGSMGCKLGPKDSAQGDHASTNVSKTTRSSIEGSSGDGKFEDKPRASARPDLGPTAENLGANPSTMATTPSPKRILLKPTKSTPTAPGTNVSPSANTRRTSTIAPDPMGNLKSFADKTPGGPPSSPTPLSGALPDSLPEDSTAPSKVASPSVSQEIPKPPLHPNVSPESDAEYLADREMARKLLGVSGKEFDAEMAKRIGDFNAGIARRIALGHPINDHNLPGDNPKIGESSRDANQMDSASDDFMSRPKASTQMDSDYVTQPGPEGLISQTHEPKADAKGKGEEKAETSDLDNDFSEENLWPGADSLDRLDSFTSFSPKWQSASANFVAGAPEYHIPRGFFGSSPEPSILASPPPFASKKPVRRPKYVDRGSSPDPTINCTACRHPLTISLTGSQAALYNVHLKNTDDMSHLVFTHVPKDYYFLHVLRIPSHKSRLIHSDKFMTLRDFTKVIRLGFDLHRPISQITVYLYGKDSEGPPLEWKPIHIMCVTDWDGSMTVGRQWSSQITVVVELVEPDADPTSSAATGSGLESKGGGAGPSK